MELYLQCGYGMMDHCRSLLTNWGGGGAILSPRDSTRDQLVRLAKDLVALPQASVLLDPQFYMPHSDHERLCSHDYWPAQYDTGTFWAGPPLVELLTKLGALNDDMRTSALVLPGLLAERVDDDWLAAQASILREAQALWPGRPLAATIALSADATRDPQQIAALLERAEEWTPESYYIVCQHPNGQYLVDDPNWLANVLDVAAGLRLRGAQTILGYCNHQLLIGGAAKVSAIASGTWMNVRSFPPEKFGVAYEEEMRQRATWYYCPKALSEYKIPFLDIAWRMGVLASMAPPGNLDGGYATSLFVGGQPTTVGFTEQAAFRHYLHALRGQVLQSSAATYDDTIAGHRLLLDNAATVLSNLNAAGVKGQQRDFTEILDVNRAALQLFDSLRGPMLRRSWSGLA
jgi:hypothetical protein